MSNDIRLSFTILDIHTKSDELKCSDYTSLYKME